MAKRAEEGAFIVDVDFMLLPIYSDFFLLIYKNYTNVVFHIFRK